MSRPPKDTGEDFLSRWSRRKSGARHEPEPDPAAKAPPPEQPAKTEAEVLEELGLPDPETLGPGSDFRAFMAAAVPDWLRRKALRRLWASNPALANLDMLVDYGEDYTDKATVVANLQTAYKAGRGYLDRVAEQARDGDEAAQGEAREAEPEQARVEGGTDAEEPEGSPAPEPPDPAEATEQASPAATAASAPGPRRRRMRFEFDES